MTINVERGFNRLVAALTVAWTVYCAVGYPLYRQYEGQMQALSDYDKGVKICYESPGPFGLEHCLDLMEQNRKNALESWSFKHFYWCDLALWRLLLPVIAVPPLALYGLSKVTVWTWRGFRPST